MIDNEYDCDWYFGPTHSGIKELDFNALRNVSHYKIWGNSQRLYWQRGIIPILFKKYSVFLMTAESRSLTDYLFFLIARILGKRVYAWTHGWYGKETRIEEKIKLWMFKQVTGIFVYGNYARKLMINRGIAPKKIHTIHTLVSKDIYDVVLNADALLVLTEWKQFRIPSWGVVRKSMNTPLVIDGRNIYDPVDLINNGFMYYKIG